MHGFILGEGGKEPAVLVPPHTRRQQRADVSADVGISLAVGGGSHLLQLVLPVFPGWVELASRNVLRKDSAKTQSTQQKH